MLETKGGENSGISGIGSQSRAGLGRAIRSGSRECIPTKDTPRTRKLHFSQMETRKPVFEKT